MIRMTTLYQYLMTLLKKMRAIFAWISQHCRAHLLFPGDILVQQKHSSISNNYNKTKTRWQETNDQKFQGGRSKTRTCILSLSLCPRSLEYTRHSYTPPRITHLLFLPQLCFRHSLTILALFGELFWLGRPDDRVFVVMQQWGNLFNIVCCFLV